MKNSTRLIVALLLVLATLTWSGYSSDGYTGTTSVYVGYGGYGPGWGYGWGGYGGYPPPVVIGPPVGVPNVPVAVPY